MVPTYIYLQNVRKQGAFPIKIDASASHLTTVNSHETLRDLREFREMSTQTCDVIAICVDGDIPQQIKIRSILGDRCRLEFHSTYFIRRLRSPRVVKYKKRWATVVAQCPIR